MALQFSDVSAAKNGLIQECESAVFGDNSYGRISNDTSLMATFTRYLNEALNTVASMVLTSDGRWQWDDTNYTDYPIGTINLGTTLGSEQQDYQFNVSFLKILRVEVMDASGAWNLLSPIDTADVYDQSLTDFLKTPGMPLYYDKLGPSIFLYPKPLATAVTTVGGLRVFFQRPPSYFSVTDTTKQPGFNSMYHRLVALLASQDYASFKQLSVAGVIAQKVNQMSDSIAESYALRNKDEHVKLSVKQFNFR